MRKRKIEVGQNWLMESACVALMHLQWKVQIIAKIRRNTWDSYYVAKKYFVPTGATGSLLVFDSDGYQVEGNETDRCSYYLIKRSMSKSTFF